MPRISAPAWLRPFLIFAAIVAVPPLLFAFVYIPQRVERAEHDAYETLSVVATEIRERLMAFDQIAAQARVWGKGDLAYLEAVLGTKATPTVLSGPVDDRSVAPGRGARGGLELRVPSRQSTNGWPEAFVAQVPVEDLVPWPLVESSFDGLLVLDGSRNGGLLGQDRRLAPLPVGKPVEFYVDGHSISFEDLQRGKAQAAKPTGLLRWGGLDVPELPRVRVAGIEYLAFLHPVAIPVGTLASTDRAPKDRELALTACALIRKDRLRQTAIALSPQLLTQAIGVIVLGLLAIPFLKLRLIAPRERMRARDVWLLASSVLMGSAIAFLLLLHAAAIDQLGARFDTELGTVAKGLVDRAQLEARAATDELIHSAPKLLRSGQPVRGSALALEDFEYPLFEALFAADRTGMQVRKWMPRTIPTPIFSIANKDYFQNALVLQHHPPANDEPTFSTTVAPTSGLRLGVFAFPANLNSAVFGASLALAKRSGVVGLATPFVSLHSPPVHMPFEFVVLSENGRVIFDSAPESFRDERFYEAIAGSEALGRALLQAEQVTSVSYRGRARRMLARPIPALNAKLVAFYDHEVVESLAGQIFGTSAVIALGIVASILAGGWIASHLLSDGAMDWIWPSPRRRFFYAVGLVGCGVVAAILAIASITRALSATHLTWLTLIVPGVATMALSLFPWLIRKLRLKGIGSSTMGISAGAYPALYVFFAVAAVVAFLGLPTAIVFRDAFALHVAAQRQAAVVRFDEAWSRSKRESLGLVVYPAAGAERCVGPPKDFAISCITPDRLFTSDINREGFAAALARFARADDPAGNAAALRPFSTVSAWVATRIAAPGSRSRELVPALTLALAENLPARVQPFTWSEIRPWLWAALCATLLALGALVHAIAQHVLGLNLLGDGILERAGDFASAREGRWLLLRPPLDAIPPGVHTIDLRDPDLDREKVALTPLDRDTVVAAVESRISDLEWRKALLRLALSETTHKQIFISEIDPLHFLAQRVCDEVSMGFGSADGKLRAASAGGKSKAEAELFEWALALSRFEKVRFATPTPSAALSNENEELLWDECQWSEPLLRIMVRLLARPDLRSFRPDELVPFVQDAAEPYYRALWALCSREEKLAMVQLAEEGLVNPKSVDLMRRLARRRLVRVDPRYQLINRSFREFARTAELPERIAEWEKTGQGEGWARIGTPLYAVGIMAVALLLFTEQEAFASVLAFATATAGAWGSIRSVYAAINGPVKS